MTDSANSKPRSAPRGLYPDIEPFDSGHMATEGKHRIYYEQSGNPAGLPVVVLHGGPGGGTSPNLRCYFNPDGYRIIMLDQRGCGKSTPHASQDISLDDNTTWHLVADIERLREKLGIDKWVVFGGSWGSTLSLAYALKHTDRVSALILRGIFLVRKSELDWFYQAGASHLFPDIWQKFIAPIPADERGDMLNAYVRRLNGADRALATRCALAWSGWEGDTLSIEGPSEAASKFSDPEFALAFARIESWYFKNGGFFETDNWVLENIRTLKDVPAWIVQGRYDVVTPMTTAWELHQAWPEAKFNLVKKAGHSSSDQGILEGLVAAADEALVALGT
ncbi:proline iminopeptidase [Asticcacaulis biprosthecium C19]|uniref:Proline iminopeptidase n=1 Tax=Asticcacaulis biprosthecium C19 TaxID=715226 RepID=F4QL49_9CAUL|nr:prolyl aminopeptidase [Asticcacaulis biprosthecium]EGF93424.1 proline iminopeptidase [Asticcacaulis biprosthecium C19]